MAKKKKIVNLTIASALKKLYDEKSKNWKTAENCKLREILCKQHFPNDWECNNWKKISYRDVLSKQVDFSATSISHHINGKVYVDPDDLPRYAKAFGVSVAYITGESPYRTEEEQIRYEQANLFTRHFFSDEYQHATMLLWRLLDMEILDTTNKEAPHYDSYRGKMPVILPVGEYVNDQDLMNTGYIINVRGMRRLITATDLHNHIEMLENYVSKVLHHSLINYSVELKDYKPSRPFETREEVVDRFKEHGLAFYDMVNNDFTDSE